MSVKTLSVLLAFVVVIGCVLSIKAGMLWAVIIFMLLGVVAVGLGEAANS